ncbi:MAG TPA: hypothetical protein VFM61_08840 [Pseudidiomarina sp.]|nr:hypothetical protein [Pseudidiomarina sp.]
MKTLLLMIVAVTSLLLSATSSAWQQTELGTRGLSDAQSMQQYLNSIPQEKFMNEERLRQVSEASSRRDITQRIRYDDLRIEANSLERNLQNAMSTAKDSINRGNLDSARQQLNVVESYREKLRLLAEEWKLATPADYTIDASTQTQVSDANTLQGPQGPAGPEVVTTGPTPPTFLGVSLTTPVVVTTVAVAVGVGVAVNKSGDDTTDTTGGNE